jgi:hypothetical protein
MRELPAGLWIGLAVFLAYILIRIEIDLYSIQRMLAQLNRHFIPPKNNDDGV